jgi:hypothetical protein
VQLFLFFSSWYCVCQPFYWVQNFALLPKFEIFCYKFNEFFEFFLNFFTNYYYYFGQISMHGSSKKPKTNSGCLILLIFNSQNWPNPLVDDHYNNHITKLSKKGKKCVCVCVCVFFWGVS